MFRSSTLFFFARLGRLFPRAALGCDWIYPLSQKILINDSNGDSDCQTGYLLGFLSSDLLFLGIVIHETRANRPFRRGEDRKSGFTRFGMCQRRVHVRRSNTDCDNLYTFEDNSKTLFPARATAACGKQHTTRVELTLTWI